MKALHLGLGVTAATLAAVIAVWLYPAPDAPRPLRLTPEDVSVVAEGAEIYQARCASCHGADLEGQPDWQTPLDDGRLPAPPHDEDGHTWHHPDELLIRITRLGTAEAIGQPDFKSDMPAFGAVLTDAEIVAALSFIKSRWPEPIRQRHDALNRRAEAAAGRR